MARCLELCATTIAGITEFAIPVAFRPIQGNLNETWLPSRKQNSNPKRQAQSKRRQPNRSDAGGDQGAGAEGGEGAPIRNESSRPFTRDRNDSPRNHPLTPPHSRLKLGIRPRENLPCSLYPSQAQRQMAQCKKLSRK